MFGAFKLWNPDIQTLIANVLLNLETPSLAKMLKIMLTNME